MRRRCIARASCVRHMRFRARALVTVSTAGATCPPPGNSLTSCIATASQAFHKHSNVSRTKSAIYRGVRLSWSWRCGPVARIENRTSALKNDTCCDSDLGFFSLTLRTRLLTRISPLRCLLDTRPRTIFLSLVLCLSLVHVLAMRTWRMQMELQLDDLHTESQVSEHRRTAASLREHFYPVCHQCERYRNSDYAVVYFTGSFAIRTTRSSVTFRDASDEVGQFSSAESGTTSQSNSNDNC